MTPKEVLKLLRQDGWYEKNQKGSHLQLIHSTKKGKITIPMHNRDLNPATLNSILKQADLK